MPPLTVTAPENEPRTVAFVTVFSVAPLMKRIVEVPAVADAVVLEIVSALPSAFTPSIVTLSAPFRSINGLPAVVAPEIVLATPPTGLIVINV